MSDDFAHPRSVQLHEAPTLDALLGWLQRRRAEKAPTYPAREVQLANLRRYSRTLLALDGEADRFLTECGRLGPVPGAVGRSGGALLVQYFRWGEDFAGLRIEPHLQYFHDELDAAAAYRAAMVRAALQIAFSNDPQQRSKVAGATVGDLGGDARFRLLALDEYLNNVRD